MQHPIRATLSLALPRRALLAGAATALLIPAAARAAETLRISVAGFPDQIYTPTMIEMIKYAATKTPGVSLEVSTAPFARSLDAVLEGAADMHLPLIRPLHPEGLPFAVTEASIAPAPFVLYSNKDKPIDMAALAEPGKYKIETDVAHVSYFDFPVVGGANAASSLKKVDAGRIDGYIFAGTTSDAVVQALGLKNLHRTLYKTFDVVGVLPKAGRGGRADRWFDTAMAAVHDDPTFVALGKKLNSGYRGPDWQPA
jgi:polar amino acid transport system substrate-binding protein